MKHKVAERNIITMCTFLSNYCQLPDDVVFKCKNMPHERIAEVIPDKRIAIFPLQYYTEEYSNIGLALLVRDRSGKILSYINPLLGNIDKHMVLRQLQNGEDAQRILINLLNKVKVNAIPVPKEPMDMGTTNKKSHQKIIDRKRRYRDVKY